LKDNKSTFVSFPYSYSSPPNSVLIIPPPHPFLWKTEKYKWRDYFSSSPGPIIIIGQSKAHYIHEYPSYKRRQDLCLLLKSGTEVLPTYKCKILPILKEFWIRILPMFHLSMYKRLIS